VTYDRPEELLADDEAQFQKGGVLVRIEPPPGLQLFETVELEVATGFAGSVVVPGQVVQLVPGAGVAVTFEPAVLEPLVEAAKGGGKGKKAPAPPHGPHAPHAPHTTTGKPVDDVATRVHAALYGNKEERWRILRDVNKMLHPYVLRNNGIGVDEILAIAKLSTVAPDLLGTIADKREWGQRPEIAIALIRNPKTPTPAAIRLLDHVSPQELRLLAKDTHTKPAVQQAARKKVLG